VSGPVERFASADLRDFAERVLGALGMVGDHARIVADCLIAANLRGVDTHGIQLLPAYVRRLVAGIADPLPKIRVVAEGPAFAAVEGGNGLGPVVGAFAMDKTVALAHAAAVAARASKHFGAAAWYAERAAARGMIGVPLSNGTPALARWGGPAAVLWRQPDGGSGSRFSRAASCVRYGGERQFTNTDPPGGGTRGCDSGRGGPSTPRAE